MWQMIIFKECLSFESGICFLVVWSALPPPHYPVCVCVFVCICVRIPGADTRPWRVLYHWRLCASRCGKSASPTPLLRCLLPRHTPSWHNFLIWTLILTWTGRMLRPPSHLPLSPFIIKWQLYRIAFLVHTGFANQSNWISGTCADHEATS